MPTVRAVATRPLESGADLLVVPVFKGGIEGPGAVETLSALGLDRVPVTAGFRGDVGQTLELAGAGAAIGTVLLVGLGRMDTTDAEQLRRASALSAGAAVRLGASRRTAVATTLAQVHPAAPSVAAVAEGFLLGAHREERFRSDGRSPPASLDILVPSSLLPTAAAATERATRAAEATVDARRLVDLPPDRGRPFELAGAIAELASSSCTVEIHGQQWLARHGCGGMLGVARGSRAGPRLVELRYVPSDPLGRVTLTGKGLTFDSGGLSLKTPEQMRGMKADMAGAASIAAACAALRDAGARVEVRALLGLVENMPGGSALCPGDVVRITDGTTVEVRDTDAAGPLVLADLLALGARQQTDALVDVATLTSSAVTALGRYAGALLGDDEPADALTHAARNAGEDVWRLPLWGDLEHRLDSEVADCNNSGDGAGAGAITAALFLRRFVGGTPWAHLDITGPAFLDRDTARGYLPAGATGFGTRTLLSWLSGQPH
ncbi:leucyl aminopeptidase family protein [Egibacter rhizosphaerae]|uniref:Probable cytosol aminopeptidase n=1 Tax=Egibacter rhizosphaerae TaxID=1670831 RepID=A0A411YKA0_9ACTN|nr:leucyl aminopeptidase family protein [Egibacter rhizosphaerae]QBI21611.1 leucyl aminopeptidase family protein [Egibacter rhizosphaerae]